MTAGRWGIVKEIVADALELEPQARQTFIETRAADPAILAEALRFLRLAESDESESRFRIGTFLPDESQDELIVPERFEILRESGRGGMGVVFECYDRNRHLRVALKTLSRISPPHLYSIKQEFRELSNVIHPNLVSLYELLEEDGRYFLSMEFVEGVDFREYLGDPGDAGRIDRIRSALPQIAAGLSRIHAAGKIHRDLKPSNLMVTNEGRVVILDFGLVTQAAEKGFRTISAGLHGGTACYMAPEQWEGSPSPASDWYSLGVILFEALTGGLPAGREGIVFDAGLPEDLRTLCLALLRAEASARPGPTEIFSLLGADRSREWLAEPAPVDLVGRETETRALLNAYAAMVAGEPVVVQLCGASGTGKTALAEHFLSLISKAGNPRILCGRCYQMEAIPYKALDGVVDQLSQWLPDLPERDLEAILPGEASSLAAIFPVLESVEAFRREGIRNVTPLDRVELRRCAFEALREMLRRIALTVPLVLWLDDLQWIDQDSATLLAGIMASPGAPPLMLICGHRLEGETENAGLAFLIEALARSVGRMSRIEVGPLSPAASERLASVWLEAMQVDSTRARSIAGHSGGLPFFIRELVYMASAGEAEKVSLDSMVWARVSQLDSDSQRVLLLVSVAGRPLEQRDIFAAVGAASNPSVLNRLAGLGLARCTGSGGTDFVEVFHDRIRESVSAHLAAEETSRLHLDLAAVMENSGRGDPEVLAIHLEAGGERARAGVYFLRAADRAASAVAFERAIVLYRKALLHAVLSPELRRDVQVKLADAAVNTGRSGEASSHYFQAAENAPPRERAGIESIGAYHLCAAGRVDEGRARFAELLRNAGHRLPTRRAEILARIAWRTLRLSIPAAIEPAQGADAAALGKIDLFWHAGAGIGTSDMLCGFALWQDCLMLALETREPVRLIRVLAFLAAFAGMTGRRHAAAGEAHLGICRELAAKIGEPPAARAILALTGGMRAYNLGHWREALAEYNRAERIMLEECRGMNWELSFARSGKLWALLCMSPPAALARESSSIIEDAESRGDLITATNAAVLPLAYSRTLLSDRPAEARVAIDKCLAGWTQAGFGLQHSCGYLAKLWTFLYEDDLAGAGDLLDRQWSSVVDSGILRLPASAVLFWETRARVLAGLIPSARGTRRLKLVHRLNLSVRRLRRSDAVHAPGFAAHVEAVLCLLRGDSTGALSHMRRAVAIFDRLGMTIHALSLQRRIGEWPGVAPDTAAIRETDRLLREQGIANPMAVSRMHTVKIA